MLSSAEYEAKIARDKEWAESISQAVKDDPRSFVKYRESRPSYNIKQFIESSVETSPSPSTSPKMYEVSDALKNVIPSTQTMATAKNSAVIFFI